MELLRRISDQLVSLQREKRKEDRIDQKSWSKVWDVLPQATGMTTFSMLASLNGTRGYNWRLEFNSDESTGAPVALLYFYEQDQNPEQAKFGNLILFSVNNPQEFFSGRELSVYIPGKVTRKQLDR